MFFDAVLQNLKPLCLESFEAVSSELLHSFCFLPIELGNFLSSCLSKLRTFISQNLRFGPCVCLCQREQLFLRLLDNMSKSSICNLSIVKAAKMLSLFDKFNLTLFVFLFSGKLFNQRKLVPQSGLQLGLHAEVRVPHH